MSTPSRARSLGWIALALAVWLGAWAWTKWARPRDAEVPAWQRPVSELDAAQQARYRSLRAALLDAEAARSRGAWPAELTPGFPLRQQGLTHNFLGEADGLRWLVVVLEPDPRQPAENSPLDDWHHRLADGRMLHVSVWTQPLTTAPPEGVVAWPAAEGWTERVR
jgi:hypothetical protein